MAVTPQYISQFIETQFPNVYRDEHSGLVEFIAAYYEWLEETNQTTKVLRQLKSNRDIDTTINDFIVHFKNTYFTESRLQNFSDTRFILKHISDLYQSKGSIRSVELLMKLMFGQEVEIFLPSHYILKPSASTWTKPIYLELSNSPRNKGLVGKEIQGSTSGAAGFIESIITKVVAQKRITIAYLSNVRGTFVTGEFVTDDGVILDAPKVIGSLSNISIVNGGRNFSIGDIFNVISSTGKSGKAKVTSVLDATGRVDFQLANGGYGYTISNNYTRTLSANATIQVSNAYNTNAEIWKANTTSGRHLLSADGVVQLPMFLFERVLQPIAQVAYISAGSNASFNTYSNGNLVVGANLHPNSAINNSNVASGYIVSSSTNTYYIIVHSGSFSGADFIYTGNVATNIQIDTVTNAHAFGELIGYRYEEDSNTYFIGISGNNKPFYFSNNSTKNFLYGLSSNTYVNVVAVGTGTGADFEIGALGESEPLTLFTDLIGANNDTGVDDGKPFINIAVEGSNSQLGFVDSIAIDTQLSIGGISNTNYPFRANGNFTTNNFVYVANVFVNGIFMANGGTSYTNSDTLTFTGGNPATSAVGTVSTFTNGTINFITLSNKGVKYRSQPGVTVSTSTGTGANLTAIMGAQGLGAHAYIKSVNSTAMVIKYIANGSFAANDVITNAGINAFANVTTVTLLTGTGYVSGDTVTIGSVVNGGANVDATATLTVNAANSGSIHSIGVDDPGTEYDSIPDIIINTSTGTGASVTVNMDWGYGFPKSGSADLTTILWDALTFSNFTIGTITSLKGINPGSGYNIDPVTLVHNPYIAGFNRRDIVCSVDDLTGVFQAGERLNQVLSLPGYLVHHSNSTSNGITLNANNDPIVLGEGVRQLTTDATGIVLSSNSTYIKISNPKGAFDDSYAIKTLSSNATITPLPSGVVEEDISAIATGRFKSIEQDPANPGKYLVFIRRLQFGQSFLPGSELTGVSSGATANVQHAYNDGNTLPIGLNAVVTANVITANGVANTVEIINSGYGYEDQSELVLEAVNSPFIVTGLANVNQQGVGPGFWKDRQSFVSDAAKIHDNNYWQEYSYVVRTGISLDKYKDILLDIVHVAGTKLFGEVVKTEEFTALRTTALDGVNVQTQNAYSAWMG